VIRSDDEEDNERVERVTPEPTPAPGGREVGREGKGERERDSKLSS
jgi:hypothetical protein